MEFGNSREQTSTEIIIDLQTEIKLLIKKAMVNVRYMYNFDNAVERLVEVGLKRVKEEELRETAKRSLIEFARKEYAEVAKFLNIGDLAIILSLAAYNKLSVRAVNNTQKQINLLKQQATKTQVNQAYSHLGNSQAKTSERQSLFGHSELVARHKEQQDMVSNLKSKTNLVICSTHSDASSRCFKWQGKVYSLNGTYGTTSDGRKYQPLENATEIYDKYGYKNGLLGFNCRHKLMPYEKGLKPVKVTRKEQLRQNQLSEKQRLFERNIRHLKDKAISFKGVDNKKYSYYKNKAAALNKEYVNFVRTNNRVQYISRTKI